MTGRIGALTPAEAAELYGKGMSACQIAEAYRITKGGRSPHPRGRPPGVPSPPRLREALLRESRGCVIHGRPVGAVEEEA
jgi:hypothetical protein